MTAYVDFAKKDLGFYVFWGATFDRFGRGEQMRTGRMQTCSFSTQESALDTPMGAICIVFDHSSRRGLDWIRR